MRDDHRPFKPGWLGSARYTIYALNTKTSSYSRSRVPTKPDSRTSTRAAVSKAFLRICRKSLRVVGGSEIEYFGRMA
ncbi:hypothetical protein BN77_p40101 [Rhizobium mesoamericanum STM3625]|uniref:Uncharacterized protein n=1 Tax=Rhizobium mesoamericanum STM3625 TaxID=1211777 RepID=K0Q504_9HYPH|nr:hypothetical protein BN77_p40101 [Rhizobium mesoamericanum STM3625]